MDEKLPTSRLEAAQVQSKTFIGKSCAKGHPGVRYTSSGGCVQCTRERADAREEKIRKLLAGEKPA